MEESRSGIRMTRNKLNPLGPFHVEKCCICGRDIYVLDSAPKERRWCGGCVPLTVTISRFCTMDIGDDHGDFGKIL